MPKDRLNWCGGEAELQEVRGLSKFKLLKYGARFHLGKTVLHPQNEGELITVLLTNLYVDLLFPILPLWTFPASGGDVLFLGPCCRGGKQCPGFMGMEGGA